MKPLYDVQMAKAASQTHGVVLAIFKVIRESVGKMIRYDAVCNKPLNSVQPALSHCLDNGITAEIIPLMKAQPLLH